MFRYELSKFLLRVLNAVDRLPDGVMVDAELEPDPRHVERIALKIGESIEDVRGALMGLHASDCLFQQTLEIPGIEPLYLWRVHPQCADSGDAVTDSLL